MQTWLIGGMAIAAFLSTVGCARSSHAPPVDVARQGGGRPPTAVSVTPVTASDIVETVEVVGSLAPKFSADVKSEVSGTVAEVFVTEWETVRKGTPLARLDTAESEAAIEALRATQMQAEVGWSRARREHHRALQLEAFGLITPQALDEARSAVDAAEAGAKAAAGQVRAAQARLAKSFITAPMDGIVAERHVSAGDRVENMGGGAPMFRIVDNRMLDLAVAVPAARSYALRVGQSLEFTTDGVPDRRFSGRVTYINPVVDEASRSVKVGVTVPNRDGLLKGGLFVRGHVVVARRQGTLQVPRQALLDWNVAERRASVFVVCDGLAEKRGVRTASVSTTAVEIVEGLDVGESVVIRGAFALRAGDAVVVEPEPGA